MDKVCIVAVMPWGTSTHFVTTDEIETAVAQYKGQGAEKVYVGEEAQEYQAAEAEAIAIQAMADSEAWDTDA